MLGLLNSGQIIMGHPNYSQLSSYPTLFYANNSNHTQNTNQYLNNHCNSAVSDLLADFSNSGGCRANDEAMRGSCKL